MEEIGNQLIDSIQKVIVVIYGKIVNIRKTDQEKADYFTNKIEGVRKKIGENSQLDVLEVFRILNELLEIQSEFIMYLGDKEEMQDEQVEETSIQIYKPKMSFFKRIIEKVLHIFRHDEQFSNF